MLNKKMEHMVSVLFPKGTKRRIAVQQIYHYIVKDWTIRADLPMHIRIFFRMILKRLHLSSPGMKCLREMVKCHDGERCFIICTGPSLIMSDLEKLKNEYTFGVNTIFMAYKQTSWRPTYYVAVDYYHLGEMIEHETHNIDRLSSVKAFVHPRIRVSSKNDTVLPCLINYVNHNPKRIQKNSFKLSSDVDVCLYDCFTVTNAAIQIAIYMGFKKIYIIGADCNYSEPKMHFIETEIDENDRNADWLTDALKLSVDGYVAAKEFAESMGVNIYNATRGGKLEVFERVDMDCIIFK